MSDPSHGLHTHPALHKRKDSTPIAALTAYDYPTARLLDEAGIDVLLVGDSLGMVVLGMEDTIDVTLQDMLRHTAAVARGTKRAVIIADLPAGSYDNANQARNSAKQLIAAGAHAVKLEGGSLIEEQIRSILDAKIAVVGHLGMLPQHVREEGRYRKKGMTEQGAARILSDAKLLERLGVSAIVLESVKSSVATEITETLAIPTIGIGSGDQCDGQIRVIHDIIGLFPWFKPPFAEQFSDLASQITDSTKKYIELIRKTDL